MINIGKRLLIGMTSFHQPRPIGDVSLGVAMDNDWLKEKCKRLEDKRDLLRQEIECQERLIEQLEDENSSLENGYLLLYEQYEQLRQENERLLQENERLRQGRKRKKKRNHPKQQSVVTNHITVNVAPAEAAAQKEVEPEAEVPGWDELAEALRQCKEEGLMWSLSAYAVFYRVIEEDYGLSSSRSKFEERMGLMGFDDCKPGTLDNAFRNNSFLTLPTEKWPRAVGKNKEPAVRLAEALRQKLAK